MGQQVINISKIKKLKKNWIKKNCGKVNINWPESKWSYYDKTEKINK